MFRSRAKDNFIAVATKRYGSGSDENIRRMLYLMHHFEGCSIRMIAFAFDCSPGAVRHWFSKYNIPIRNYKSMIKKALPVMEHGYPGEYEYFFKNSHKSFESMAKELSVDIRLIKKRYAEFLRINSIMNISRRVQICP